MKGNFICKDDTEYPNECIILSHDVTNQTE